MAVPRDAGVTVHRINERCIMRVLVILEGPRLADALYAVGD